MVHHSHARRSPARYIVPLILVAAGLSTYLIVEHALDTSNAGSGPSSMTATRPVHVSGHHAATPGGSEGSGSSTTTTPTVYVIRAGDTLGAIASRFGISIATIEALNPQLNPNALQVGQRVRLSR